MKRAISTSIIILSIAFSLTAGAQAAIVTTTAARPWVIQSVNFEKIKTEILVDLELFPQKKQQAIKGFGGCFNEMGWSALNELSQEEKQKVLNSFFDKDGCAFTLCRMPLGANDYSMDWYSYNETDGDFAMKNFSVLHDKKYLIPYIKEAQKINPAISIWASPWCPPSWMKTNKHYACEAAKENDLSPEKNGEEMITQFEMKPEYLSAYALYFKNFINAYQKEGIKISAVHPQNEPNSCQKFPSCIWRPEDIATFVGKYLGPELDKNNIKTDIWLGTIERPNPERVDTILQNMYAKKYIKGVGFQWGGKGAIAYVKQNYPQLQLMQTETECGDGSNDWAAAEHTFELMKHYFANGANAYMYWNMVLEEKGISRWGWKQNSMVSVNYATKTAIYNPEFYLMKHLSHFVKPGAYKIEQSGAYEDAVSFINTDGSVVILLANTTDAQKNLNIKSEDKLLKVILPEKSFSTIIIQSKK